MSVKPKVGVFICECGGNIGDVVDVKAAKEAVAKLDGVAFVEHYPYVCSKPGLALVKDSIKKHGLNRVVIGSCTARMHQILFKDTVKEAGVNEYLLERVNLREQCSWTHAKDKEGATEKAVDLLRGGVERAKALKPLTPIVQKVNREVLVIGGGVAGMLSSLQLANLGYNVHMVERQPSIGGHMTQFSKVFPTLDCSQCIITPKMVDVALNPNIHLYTNSEIQEISGYPGNFKVKTFIKPRGVDIDRCTNCGRCTEKCPVTVESEFDERLGKRKAIYIPFPQAVPAIRTVDFDHCLYRLKGVCQVCKKFCPVNCVDLEDKGKTLELPFGAIVVATGYQIHSLPDFPEYSLGNPNVINALQMERLLSVTGPTGGRILRPDNKQPPKKIAYVLCCGSRDANKGVPYCSRVCCMYAIKQSLLIREYFPDIHVWIYYIDIRSFGKGYEEFYKRAQHEGVNFIRGKVSEVEPDNGQLIVRAEDSTLQRPTENKVDMVVLCPALIPAEGTDKLAAQLRTPVGSDQYMLEKHPKLDPVTSQYDGVYLAGCISGLKDIRDTSVDAMAAAAKTAEFLGKGEVVKEPYLALLASPDKCDACGECVKICPQKAITIEVGKAKINQILCNGCGLCVSTCPKNALDLSGYTDEAIRAQIDGILAAPSKKAKILAFVEKELVYTAVDMVGLNRTEYPSSIRIIPLPSIGRIKAGHVLYAFAKGADGVIMLEATREGPLGEAHKIALEKANEFRKTLAKNKVQPARFMATDVFVPEFAKLSEIFKKFDEIVQSLGSLQAERRKAIPTQY